MSRNMSNGDERETPLTVTEISFFLAFQSRIVNSTSQDFDYIH